MNASKTGRHHQAECDLLGAILLEPDTMDEVLDKVQTSDFSHKHGGIFTAMIELYEADRPVDISGLEASGCNGEYLAELRSCVPSAANAAFHAEIVSREGLRRKALEILDLASRDARNDRAELHSILDMHIQQMLDLVDGNRRNDIIDGHSGLAGLCQVYDQEAVRSGLLTGFSNLDDLLGGLWPGSLTVLGARPSVGKTAFAMSVARHVLKNTDKAVVFFSLEMTWEEIVERLIAIDCEIDLRHLRQNILTNDERTKIHELGDQAWLQRLHVVDRNDISPVGARAIIRRLSREFDLGLVIYDYLQLTELNGSRNGTRDRELGQLSNQLKGLAKEFRVAALVLSQLNRSVESRPNPMPRISDLRESGVIEQAADVVLLLCDSGASRVIKVGKNRHGPAGCTCVLGWESANACFYDRKAS